MDNPDRRTALETEPSGLSVVIVSHNEGQMLRRTVDNFLDRTPGLTDVVVVDDASTDASSAFLTEEPGRYPGVRLIRMESSVGISAARNAGGRAARGRIVAFSDAHVDVEPGWVEPLAEALADPEVGEVTPAIGYLDGRPGYGYGFTWNDPSMRMRWLAQAEAPRDIPFICGCFVVMRREVFDAVGGFDEGMYRWGYEDAELSLRLWLAGYRCRVVPESKARHLFRKRFPYEVDWSGVIYNGLRMAVVHLHPEAVEKVVGHFSARPAFARAWTRLVASDTWERRDLVRADNRRRVAELLTELGVGGVV